MASTRFSINPDVCYAIDKGGTIVLSIEKGVFYSVTGIGSIVWAKLTNHSEGMTLDTIADDLTAEFNEVPRQEIEGDLESLLEDFRKKEIIQVNQRSTQQTIGPRELICIGAVFLTRLAASLLIHLKLNTFAVFLYLTLFQFVGAFGGFRVRRYAIKRWPIAKMQRTDQKVLNNLCVTVTKACTWFPKLSKCLQQSTATTCFLRQHGFPAEMVIGVHRMPFSSHAWVEVNGKVVNDHRNVQTYFKAVDRW
jgi:Transglutaminase-like superfamily/Coenzyme PQQ synthesis protein D (PqqD)